MPASGLFLIPPSTTDTSPLPDFLARLTTNYDPSPLPPWTLHHRLYRSTPKTPDDTPTRYLQILTLSHHPTVSYIAITSTAAPRPGTETSSSAEPATVLSIPQGTPTEDFAHLLTTKFGPLWTQRQSLSVRNGVAFEVGGFTVRVGEVMAGRGVVVEVLWAGEEEGKEVVQTFWDSLGVGGAREFVGVEEKEEGMGCVRLWCEVLRIRS